MTNYNYDAYQYGAAGLNSPDNPTYANTVSGYFPEDIFNLGAPQANVTAPRRNQNFQQRVVLSVPGKGKVIQWRLLLEEARGGLNKPLGLWDEDYDRISSSDADARWPLTLILPQLTTNATTPDPGGTLKGIHSCHVYDQLVIGAGSTSNSALFTETSSTDPTIIAKTFTPSGAITSVTPVTIGGPSVSQRLAVGYNGANPVQIVASNFTVAGTMDAATNNCWGIIQTFLNNNQLLIYAGNAIRHMDSTAAITSTVINTGLNNIPMGGYALGMAKLGGAPIRPLWVFPLEDQTGGMLANGAEKPGRIVFTNQEGTDYQEIPLGLKYVFFACLMNNSAVVATDKERIIYYDGRAAPRDLQWVAEREPDSDKVYECRGLFTNGPELWIDVNQKASANGTGSTKRWWEVYNTDTNSWYQVSATQTLSSTGSFGLGASGALPYSKTTGFTHIYSDGSWRRIFVPVYGYNPYNLYRQTSGSQTSTGNEYELTATYTSPKWELPGLEGWPKITTRISFMGDVDSGGTTTSNATVVVTAGNMSATFATGFSDRAQTAPITDNQSTYYKLQVSEVLTRNSGSTRWTPQGFPVMIEGLCFIGDNQLPEWFLDDVR